MTRQQMGVVFTRIAKLGVGRVQERETVMVPGEYPVVFECCVLALGDANVRVESANPQSGVISGRTPLRGPMRLDRVDVVIYPGHGQSTVHVFSEMPTAAASDFGRNARNVEYVINALLARSAPLAGNPAAFATITAVNGGIPSMRYSAAPMRTYSWETPRGQALQWGCLALSTLVLIVLILGVFLNASQH